MRAPFQEGDFPAPVKYGYLNVGVVEEGPAALLGRTVFCLYPHQTRYVVPASAVTVGARHRARRPRRARRHGRDRGERPVGRRAADRRPDRRRRRRHGRAAPSPPCSPASPASGSSWSTPTPRAPTSPRALGVDFALPGDAAGDCDLVVHASATEAGLTRSLELLAPEGTVLELSWYGDRRVSLPLGEAFHSRRLAVRSSQVGSVSSRPGARRTYADRLALALDLLADPAFDALITGEMRLRGAAGGDARLASGSIPALCHRVRYDAE